MASAPVLRAGVILIWLGGSGSFEDRTIWDRFKVPGSTDTIKIDNGLTIAGLQRNSVVSVNSNENIGDLYITAGDTLNVANGVVFTLSMDTGTVQNDGTILLNSGGSATALSLKSGTFTFSGSGSLTLSNNPNNQVYGNSSTDALVNGASHTIQGAGQLGVDKMTITNLGTIVANQSNSLVIDPSAGGLTNSGTLRATSGATLRITGGNYTNTGGRIEALDASSVQFESATVTGGTLSSSTSGHLVNAVASTFTDVTIATGSVFDINDNTAATFAGTISNQGTINLNSAGNSTDFVIGAGNLTLTGGGNLTLSNNGNNRIYGSPSTGVLVNLNNTISGTGQLGLNQLQIDNRGTISANYAGATLTVNPNSAGVANTGTMQATNGGFLRLTDGTYTNAGGTIQALGSSTVQLETSTISGGTLRTTGSGVITTVSGANFLDGALTIDGGAQLTIADNTNLTLLASGTYTHNGTITLASAGNSTDLIVKGGDVTLGGSGTIALGENGNNRIYGSATSDRLVLGANLTLQGSGQLGTNLMGLVNNGLVVANQGTALEINPSSAGVTNNGTLRATNGATLRLIDGAFTNDNGLIEAQAGSAVQFQSATVTGGTFTSVDTGRLVHATNSTFNGITLSTSSVLNINDNTAATFGGIFNNQGSVNLNSGGNSTDFVGASTGLTLSGGGTITLGNNSNNRFYASGAATIVNQDNTIRGLGQLGVNMLTLDNRATVDANVSGGTLTINLSGTSSVNTGTMQATNGGILLIDDTTLNNAKGTLRADAKSQVQLANNAVITGGTLLTNGDGVIRNVSGTNTLGGALSIATGGQIIINDNTSLVLLASGSYANSGTISLASGGNLTDLKISGGDVTVSGSGSITLGNNGNNRIYGAATTDRFINSGSTIQGTGQLGVDLMGLVNSGMVKANNQSTTLTIDPSAAGVTNTGTLRAENGATLRLANGVFNNTSGRIEASGANSVVEFSNAIVQNGVLATDLGGVLRHVDGSTFSDVTLASGGTLQIRDNTAATFTGTFTSSGTVQLISGGNSTDLLIGTGGLTLAGGVIELGNNSNNRIYSPSNTTMLVNQSATIRGVGQLGVNLTKIDNRSLIDANVSGGTLVVDPNSNGMINTGTMSATNGGILLIRDGTFFNSGGTILAGAGSRVDLNVAVVSGGALSGGTIHNVAGSTLSSLSINSGTTVEIPDNTTLTLTGTIANAGTLSLQSGGNSTDLVIGTGGATLTGHGVIELNNNSNNRVYGVTGSVTLNNVDNTIRGGGQLGVNQLVLTNTGTIQANQPGAPLTVNLSNTTPFNNQGTLHATAGATLAFTDALSNAGLVKVDASSTFSAASTFTQTTGVTSLQGTFSATSATFSGGVLAGSGTISGAVSSGAVIAPGANGSGDGIGQFTFNNALSLTSTSVLLMQLNSPTSYDKISAPSAALGGALLVSFTNGFQNTILSTDSFTLLSTTNGLTGTFAGLSDGTRFGTTDGFSFQINYQANGVVLSNFSVVPEPSTYAMIAIGAGMICGGWRRRRPKS